jgi:hypothetical protein
MRRQLAAVAMLLLAAGAAAGEPTPSLLDLAALRRLWTEDPMIRDFVGPCGECGDPGSFALPPPPPEAVAAMLAALARDLSQPLTEPPPTVAVRLSPPPCAAPTPNERSGDVLLIRE